MPSIHKKKIDAHLPTRITKNDIKLLLCVAVFSVSVALKYCHGDTVTQLRTQAAILLRGGTDTSEVIATVGKIVGQQEDILSVFAVQSPTTSTVDTSNTADSSTISGTATQETLADTNTTNTTSVPVYAESGYAEDLTDRQQTLFPKEADNTAYVMAFTHIQPTTGTLSSDYGMRTHPINNTQSYHYGLDIAAPKGTAIVAFADGVVRESGNGSYGKYLIVDHADGFSTLYAHCDVLLAEQGATVKVGDEIAQVGATGNATGNHLHFEIWRDGKALNPDNYVTY